MKICEKDFILTPISESDPSFDLELLYTIKGKEERQEFKVAAYGISIGHAIKIIAHYRVCNNRKDEAISMLEYLKEYNAQFSDLKKLCGI